MYVLHFGHFSKTGKTRASHRVKMMTRTWKLTQMTHWPSDPVPCLVATYATCGGIFDIHLTANLPTNLPVKKILKSVKIGGFHQVWWRSWLRMSSRTLTWISWCACLTLRRSSRFMLLFFLIAATQDRIGPWVCAATFLVHPVYVEQNYRRVKNIRISMHEFLKPKGPTGQLCALCWCTFP